jgi:peptidoglycan/xylan/chitin deacetylase (PgdA/CDA1 family)
MEPPAFSGITSRAPLRFRGDARVAVWVVVNVEVFPFRRGGPALQPHLASDPEIANYAWRDYGNRVGIWRMFELFDDLGIPVTAAMNAATCTEQPAVADGVIQRSWCVIGHGVDNTTPQAGLGLDAERELIVGCLDTLEKAGAARPRGWLTPGFSVSEHTHELLVEAGIEYTGDWGNDDEPFWLELGAGRLAAVPYHLEANDISLCLSQRLDGPGFARAVTDHFDTLCRDGAGRPRVMTLGLHPFLVGQPGRIAHLRAALEHMLEAGGVWWANGDDLYDNFSQGGAP